HVPTLTPLYLVILLPLHHISTLFPYTTLFRSIHPTSVRSCIDSSVPIVDRKIDNGRTANIINKTYPIMFGWKIWIMVSICKEDASIIKIAEISKIDTFSLKCLKSSNELIPIFANVIPIAVTDNNPAPFTKPSGNVKHSKTTATTTGDFKNSGIWPPSNIQPIALPQNHPKNIPKAAIIKKNNRLETVLSSNVKNVIISNANTAKSTPIGSTIIPSHFKIFAGLAFNFDWRNKGIITVGPVTINSPPITKATSHDKPAT